MKKLIPENPVVKTAILLLGFGFFIWLWAFFVRGLVGFFLEGSNISSGSIEFIESNFINSSLLIMMFFTVFFITHSKKQRLILLISIVFNVFYMIQFSLPDYIVNIHIAKLSNISLNNFLYSINFLFVVFLLFLKFLIDSVVSAKLRKAQGFQDLKN